MLQNYIINLLVFHDHHLLNSTKVYRTFYRVYLKKRLLSFNVVTAYFTVLFVVNSDVGQNFGVLVIRYRSFARHVEKTKKIYKYYCYSYDYCSSPVSM